MLSKIATGKRSPTCRQEAENRRLTAEWSEITMQGETKEQWRKLCEQAAVEQDPEKLLKLAKEISALLDEKEQRLHHVRTVTLPNAGSDDHAA